MGLLFYLLGVLWTLLVPQVDSYTASVVLDSRVINVPTNYTFTFQSLVDNNPKTVTLPFPSNSDLSSLILTVVVNNAMPLGSAFYFVNISAKTIVITGQTPVSNALVIRVTNVHNPPTVEQFVFNTVISAPEIAPSSPPFVNYQSGTLISCIWKFNKFTGSANSIAEIDITLGNRLLPGVSAIQIRFPNLYEDSDIKFLTMTTPTLNYSIDGGQSYSTPLASPSPAINTTRITFSVNIPGGLGASNVFRIRLIGVTNPPTQRPSGRGFTVFTFDSLGRSIDRINECSINPLDVLVLNARFDNTSLYVNDPYRTPKIIINQVIPFTIFDNDDLELNHNQAMSITSLGTPWISITRGSPTFVSFNPNPSKPITATTRFFIGDMDNTNQASATSQLQLRFDIRAPHSQKPWQFLITLSRPSGAYVQIKATMQAYAISINSTRVSISATTTEMAMQSQYTLNVVLQRAISRNGKLMLGFDPEYDIKTGPCAGFNGGAQITSTSTCNFQQKNGFEWLVYKIGQNSINTLDVGTSLMIRFLSPSIKNTLYPNTYTFRLEIYYTELDDSLVARAQIFGSITMTKHTSFKASLLNPDFTVYELASLTIRYTNEVYIPQNSVLEFILPAGVISFDFTNKIIINSEEVRNATLNRNFAGGLTGQVTVKQDIDPDTEWAIPLQVKTPIICGDYPSIVFKIIKAGVTYEEVTSGLNINVNFPSTELSAIIQPNTNNEVDAITDYKIRIQSRVPLSAKFYVIVTLPSQVRLNQAAASTCSATNGICSSISNPFPSILSLTLEDSVYSLSNPSQDFTFTVNSFINPRFQGETSNWKVQLKGMFNNMVKDISEGFTTSSNYRVSSGAVCELDQTKSYYRSNPDPILIKCAFVNDLIQGDYITIGITSNAYTLNPGFALTCTSPSLTSIECINSYSSTTTIIMKVTIKTTFTSDKNKLTLQIAGLISNPDTTYETPPVPLEVKRFNFLEKPVDEGTFNYSISCNDNLAIKSKKCRTCLSEKCVTCYSGMYLSSLGICVRDCPIDTQFRALNSPTSLICQSCTPPCYTCQSSSITCLSCINSSTFYLNRASRTCQTTCDTSSIFWINTVDIPGTKICDRCLAQCKRCVNNTLVGCLECQSGNVLEGGSCRLGCLDPRSYVRNGICVACNFACETCNGSGSNNCIQCKELYYMNNGFCVSACPSNKYSLPNGTCGCQSNCATCASTSPTFCVSCLDETNFLYNGSCLASCPPYTTMISNQCVECPKNCIECVNTVTCKRCTPGFLIHESLCYGDCNSISFQYDTKGDTCILCPTGCDKCSDNICTSCLLGYTKKQDECIRECVLTNSCDKVSPVPESITPAPATIAFVVWVGIVYVAQWFNPKIYAPYSVVFLTSALEYLLIIGTTIHSSSIIGEESRRLLEYDTTQRPIILNLLIVALVVNYVMNIIFAVIFFKYLVPLINAPRQVDYITIGAAFIMGMLTNYRFCLIFFSKMFPKPRINVQFSSRLTPVHYLCIGSVFLSGFALGACGIILKNEYPLTDIFMLAIDILIIEVILILFSVWMVAVDKNPDYFDDQKKVYHLQENYKTQENIMGADKSMTKNHLNIRDEFDENQNTNALDQTNQKKLLGGSITVINVSALNLPESQNQKPLEKRLNRLDDQKVRMVNKIQNSFETDISDLNKHSKNKKIKKSLNDSNNQILKPKDKQNLVEYDKKTTKAIFDSKKFQTSDEQNNLPKMINSETNNNGILVDVEEPSSDEIPNLPITNSVFHERASSEFGQKVKPKKSLNRHEQSSQIIKAKSPLVSPSKGKNNDIDYSQAESKSMMKKKNKFFDSGVDNDIPQRDKEIDELDIERIIKEKIVVMERKETKDEKISMEANNISSIEKREDENSQFNEQVSPSWFNIQNQRFDISSVSSDFENN